MNSILKLINILILLITLCSSILAQKAQQVSMKIPKTSLVGIAPTGNQTITIYPKFENNIPLSIASNWWINYSAIKGSNNSPYQLISAAISEGNVPEGYKLILEATTDAGQGGGEMGISVGQVNMTKAFQPIITTIGSCYTGNSTNHGHQLFIKIQRDLSIEEADPIEEVDPITIIFKIESNEL